MGPTKRRHFELESGLLTARVLQVKNDSLKELQLKPSSAEEICRTTGDVSWKRYVRVRGFIIKLGKWENIIKSDNHH